MIKIVELIIVVTLLIFSFLAGVKYSDSVKNHVSWLFENKEEEIELPDLSNENAVEIAPSEGTIDGSKTPDQANPAENTPNDNTANDSPNKTLDNPNTAVPANPGASSNQPKIDLEQKKQ
ncbi:hypothetical protein LBMAG18_12320 [Alphaproteobacteria bacterium]|nr:hypothetical protein LBMAG18_12320 [Alphaproteobacteria bacterium]